ncbi:hypothetical protein OROGR_032641 [Orobanche gracilis]
MDNLKTDSPVSRHIACSFLQFLNSVQPSSGVDSEALDVAKECLAEIFKIDQSSINSLSSCDSLVDIFSFYKANARADNGEVSDAQTLSLGKNDEVLEASASLDKDRRSEPLSPGEDEIFGQFFGALERIHYFRVMPDGTDDQTQLDRATYLFHNAVEEMEKAGCQTFDQKLLAETFKAQGNKAMQSKLYAEAVELYTFAVALCEDNAVYHCNRAAAYTQINQYTEAVQDCLKSIEINPNYSKAYSRLGFAYYAQGKYRDAVDKGFMKALQLDPSNDSVKENIRVAEQKLKEEQQRAGHGQGSTSTMPFNIDGGIPSDFTTMFMNMAGNASPGQNFHSGTEGETRNEPEIRISGNVNFNVDEVPEEFSGAFRSMMGMFHGAASNGNQQDDNNNNNINIGRSTAS